MVPLRVVDPERARVWRRRGTYWTARLADAPDQVDLVLSHSVSLVDVKPMPAMGICVETHAGRFVFLNASPLFLALTGVDLDARTSHFTPAMLLGLALRKLHPRWWELFGSPRAGAPLIPDSRVRTDYSVSAFDGAGRLIAQSPMRISARGVQYLASCASWRRRDPEPDAWRTVRSRFKVVIGRSTLSIGEFGKLESKSVIRVVESRIDSDWSLDVRAFGLRLGTRLDLSHARWQLHVRETPMGDLVASGDEPSGVGSGGDATGHPNAAELAVLASAAVPVSFCVGTLHMSLVELSQLRAGDVVQLAGSAAPDVSIWVGDSRVGEGELVSVAGGLGVEIRRIGVAR